jgi:hypothetical protein
MPPPSNDGGDDALAKGLSKAKTARAEKPAFFVLVLKGSEGVLVVDRKKIPSPQIAAAYPTPLTTKGRKRPRRRQRHSLPAKWRAWSAI